MNEGDGGIPGDPLEGGDTEPNAVIELGDGDLEAVPEPVPEAFPEKVTGAFRCCTECGLQVFAMATSPVPRLEDVVSLWVFWEPKSADGASERCTVSGPADAPVWWMCVGDGKTGWFAARGVFRVRVERI